MEALIDQFLSCRRFAVVGASRDKTKYGYIIYENLLKKGYEVYPVNPNAAEIDGDKVYPTLDQCPHPPEVVVIVTPPEVTEQIVQQCLQLELTRVWMQPGAESEMAIRFCERNGLALVHSQCVMELSRPLSAGG